MEWGAFGERRGIYRCSSYFWCTSSLCLNQTLWPCLGLEKVFWDNEEKEIDREMKVIIIKKICWGLCAKRKSCDLRPKTNMAFVLITHEDLTWDIPLAFTDTRIQNRQKDWDCFPRTSIFHKFFISLWPHFLSYSWEENNINPIMTKKGKGPSKRSSKFYVRKLWLKVYHNFFSFLCLLWEY